jgi:CubicO group peptidase (beta-lactamase class C family)
VAASATGSNPRRLAVAILGLVTAAQPSRAEFNYHQQTERLLSLGRQALLTCNGLFVSNRTLDQIYEQELKLDEMPVLPRDMVQIDDQLRTVAVGGPGASAAPVMRAVYREGLGCIVLSPDQTFADIDSLPQLVLPPPPGDAATIPWPDGDLVSAQPLPAGVDAKALEAAWDWALDRKAHGHPSQITLSLLVVYRGGIVFERYAPGVDMKTRTRTWSTAKSVASALIGIAVSQGKLALDSPLPYPEGDPRRTVTLRHVLHMSSGLDPVDNQKCAVVGSCLSYFGGTSSVAGALDRGLVSRPGTRWDYENYDTLLAVLALKTALGAQDYRTFPRQALLDRIGMRSTLLGVDRFGDFVLSSQVYTNARDLARFGLLYLNRGRWPHKDGATIIPESWIDFSRTPAPATAARGRFYGGQWWLVPDDRIDIPADAYATNGNRGQYTIVVPSHDLVIVRRGLDWLPARHSFSGWDLTREVLKALPKRDPTVSPPAPGAGPGSGRPRSSAR